MANILWEYDFSFFEGRNHLQRWKIVKKRELLCWIKWSLLNLKTINQEFRIEWDGLSRPKQIEHCWTKNNLRLTESLIEILFFNLYFWINLKYIFQYVRLAAPYQEPWTEGCVDLFWFVFWGFIVEWIQYLTYLSFYHRQDLIWNLCNSFLWCFLLALYLQSKNLKGRFGPRVG